MIDEIIKKTINVLIINEYEKTLLTRLKYGYKLKKEDEFKMMLLNEKLRLYYMLRR